MPIAAAAGRHALLSAFDGCAHLVPWLSLASTLALLPSRCASSRRQHGGDAPVERPARSVQLARHLWDISASPSIASAALMLACSRARGALAGCVYAFGGDAARGRHFHALFQLQLMGLNGFLTADLFNLRLLRGSARRP